MTLIEPSWDDAREFSGSLRSRIETETCALIKAVGRTVAHDLQAMVNLPTYETSAMDGYAVSSADGTWRIAGDVRAGEPFAGVLGEGEALRIATGAVIPEGTFGILRWEDATVSDEFVTGKTTSKKDFRPIGEEAKFGEILIKAGQCISPGMVGLLAAAGYDDVKVVRKPKVSLLLLGDEILLSGIPKDGLVRDSLGVQLPIWFNKLGCEVINIEYISDTLDETIDSIKRASQSSDVIVTTGGTADGPRDFLHAAIAQLQGSIHIDTVAVRPGHPQLLGEVSGVPILGLPGNPQSAVVALITLGLPLIYSLLGRKVEELPLISSEEKLQAQANFTRLVPGTMRNGEFKSGMYLGSAMLRSLASADGFAVLTSPWSTLRWLELPS